MYYLRTKPAANAIQFTVDRSATLLNKKGKGGEGDGGEGGGGAGAGAGGAAAAAAAGGQVCTDDVCLSCQG